ncbi:hypothetical protein MARINOS108_11587 [Marinoscillum sp. 108]|nr:hypothetical protein MARINOS108_11587 [Marinoscillum sp. 108]
MGWNPVKRGLIMRESLNWTLPNERNSGTLAGAFASWHLIHDL